MPCGWVDISLSITSVGSSSLGFPLLGRQSLRIYARDKENRIHRGGTLCTTEGKNSLHDVGWLRPLALRLPGNHKVRPPSTTTTCPVMNFDRTRNTTASA